MTRFCTFFILGGLATFAVGRDVFVAPSGRDSADGLTPATALKSFAAATSKLHPGDILRLQRNATWHETLRLPSGVPNRPIRVTAYGGGELPTIDGAGPKPLDICIDASASYLMINSLRVTHAAATDRGAITVWANDDRDGLTIEDCRIENNAGRGIWIAGEAGKTVQGVYIHRNTFTRNDGSGVLVSKLSRSWVMDNDFDQNCRKPVDPWQAAVRVWSGDVSDLWISSNRIDNGLHQLDRGAGMGIHIDETGKDVFVTQNDIRHCDAAGIEIENTRGVTVRDNVISDVHTGVFVYRAGHDHVIDHNTILARSQGIVLQGWRAHGVDAGPEIEVGGNLLTGNAITNNIAVAEQFGSLKLTGGGERLNGDMPNVIRHNALGPERKSLVEIGSDTIGDYSALPPQKFIDCVKSSRSPIDVQTGDLELPSDWGDLGARRFPSKPH